MMDCKLAAVRETGIAVPVCFVIRIDPVSPDQKGGAMMLRRWKYLFTTFWLLSVVGCHDRGPYSPIVREDEQPAHQLRHDVTMISRDARNALMYQNSTAKRLPSGQVLVKAQMENLYHNLPLWSDVRVVFYREEESVDEELCEVKVKMQADSTEWQTVAFPPREVVQVQGLSMRNDVTSYNVQFRNVKSKGGGCFFPPHRCWDFDRIMEKGWWREGLVPE